MTDVASLQMERDRLRAEVARIRDMTGMVRHTTHDECHGCGCISLSAEEAVAELRVQRDAMQAELAEQKELNLQLAERLAACSEVLGKAAGRGKVCQCSVPEGSA